MSAASLDDEDILSGINVTPLVDVCLVLVIIFMVTAPLMADPVLKVELPVASTREGEENDKITITLDKQGQLALEHKIYREFSEMEEDLKVRLASSESKLVVLRADKEARHGRLTELMAKAKEAGALSLTIATEQKR